MLRVYFHFSGDTDAIELWPDETSHTELQGRAEALLCWRFTATIEEDAPCVPSGSWVPPEWLDSTLD